MEPVSQNNGAVDDDKSTHTSAFYVISLGRSLGLSPYVTVNC
jgi:hypothetical protein